MLMLQFDGLFRGAPHDLHLGNSAGIMCYGWVILRENAVLAYGHGGYARSENASSNVAEYLALIEGLDALLDMNVGQEPVLIRGDAKSVIEQMEGKACVSANSIRPFYRQASKLANRVRRIFWEWNPRRYNQSADALTRRALRQIFANPVQYQTAFQDKAKKTKGHRAERMQPLLDLRTYRRI